MEGILGGFLISASFAASIAALIAYGWVAFREQKVAHEGILQEDVAHEDALHKDIEHKKPSDL